MASISDSQAFEAELIALIPSLRAFARALCGDRTDGDDLAQETLAKALTSRESFELGTNMKAWTFMIMRNQFYSEKRRSWRSTALDPDVAAQTLVAVTSETDRLELDEVRRALAKLTPDQRDALVLIGAAGLAYEEASEILGCPVGTIKSRVSRARDALALLLAAGDLPRDRAPPEEAASVILRHADRHISAA